MLALMTPKLSTRSQLKRPHQRLILEGLVAISKPLLRTRLPLLKKQILSSGGGVAGQERVQLIIKLKRNRLRGRQRRLLTEKKQLASLRVDADSDAHVPSQLTRRSNPGHLMSDLLSTLTHRVAAETRATRDDLNLHHPSSNKRTGEGLLRAVTSVTTGSVPLLITTIWVARSPATVGDGTMARPMTSQLTFLTRTLVVKVELPTLVGVPLTESEKATATCLSTVRSETRTSASTIRM